MASPSGDIWSPYYRITAYQPTGCLVRAGPATGRRVPRRRRDPAPGDDSDRERPTSGTSPPPDLRWFPDQTYDRVLIIGAGSGTDTAARAARGEPTSTRSRSIRVSRSIGRDSIPGRVPDPRVDVHVNDGRAFLRGAPSKYDLIIFAQTDSLTLVSDHGERPARDVPVHRRVRSPPRGTTWPPTACSSCTTSTGEPWLVTKLDDDDRRGVRAASRCCEAGRAPSRRSSRRARRSRRSLAAHRRRWHDVDPCRGRRPVPSGDRRLAVPLPADAGRSRRTTSAASRSCSRWPWSRRLAVRGCTGTPIRRLQPPFLRARRRVPAARDAEPRHVQPAVRHDVDRQRARVLRDPRDRAGRDRGERKLQPRQPVPFYAGLLASLLFAWAMARSAVLVDPP